MYIFIRQIEIGVLYVCVAFIRYWSKIGCLRHGLILFWYNFLNQIAISVILDTEVFMSKNEPFKLNSNLVKPRLKVCILEEGVGNPWLLPF